MSVSRASLVCLLSDISVAFRQQLKIGSYLSLLKVPYRVLALCMTPLMMINVLCSGVCTVSVCERAEQTMSVHFLVFLHADVDCKKTCGA